MLSTLKIFMSSQADFDMKIFHAESASATSGWQAKIYKYVSTMSHILWGKYSSQARLVQASDSPVDNSTK